MKNLQIRPKTLAIVLMILIGVLATIKPIETSMAFRVMAYIVGVAIVGLWLWALLAWLKSFSKASGTTISSGGRKYVKYFACLLLAAPLILLFLTLEGDYVGRRMPIYGESLKTALASASVSSNLGSPIKVGWPVDAEWSGSACELSIPLSGSHGSAHLHVSGTKKNGDCEIGEMYLVNKGSDLRIPIPSPPL